MKLNLSVLIHIIIYMHIYVHVYVWNIWSTHVYKYNNINFLHSSIYIICIYSIISVVYICTCKTFHIYACFVIM